MKVKTIYESVSEVDNQGNELSPEQVEFFKDSKVRDYSGKLLLCYHTSPVEGITEFKNGFFTDDANATTHFPGKPYKCYLNITNPFVYDADYNEYDNLEYNGEIVSADDIVYDIMKNHSQYDGVIIRDVDEQGTGGMFAMTDYIPFGPEQIKSITNKNPTNSKNINENT